ncbi:MAG TPA: CYTH and CHAD domain-containing protein [Actinomycetota bacterium]|nr:CYTH and CHAD domain-containing protein [Actinomycetota bacterium]
MSTNALDGAVLDGTPPPVLTGPDVSTESEDKLEADPGFEIPDLSGVEPGAQVAVLREALLEAVYFDTADLRLARNSGITLRYRRDRSPGSTDEGTWTLKLPEDATGTGDRALIRQELSWPGSPDDVPPQAAALVRAITRRAPLQPVARLTTQRRRLELRDREGPPLAEIDDDLVSIAEPVQEQFRQIEVEWTGEARPGLRKAVLDRLRRAGARSGDATPKVFRALGLADGAKPDVEVPHLDRHSTMRDVVAASIAGATKTMIERDPGVRLGGDIEHVHKARVATRRLRSDLRTFRPLLDAGWERQMRNDLRLPANALGEVRDADVLMAELRAQIASLEGPDAAAAARLLAKLGAERDQANARLLEVLDGEPYALLLDRLVAAAANPPMADPAAGGLPASHTLPGLVARPWKRLRRWVAGLGKEPADEALHEVRKRAKQLRYASEAAAPVRGRPAVKLAGAAENLQEVLGEFHDAVVSAGWLRDHAGTEGVSTALVAGRIVEREERRRAEQRSAWPKAWKRLKSKKRRGWLKALPKAAA